MRTLFFCILLAIFGCGKSDAPLTSQASTPQTEAAPDELLDLVDSGTVFAEVTEAWGSRATVSVGWKRGVTRRPLSVKVSAGTLLKSAEKSVQDLIVVENRTFRMSAESARTSVDVEVCCVKPWLTGPARFPVTRFDLKRLPAGNGLRSLAERLATTDLPPDQKYRAFYDLAEAMHKRASPPRVNP